MPSTPLECVYVVFVNKMHERDVICYGYLTRWVICIKMTQDKNSAALQQLEKFSDCVFSSSPMCQNWLHILPGNNVRILLITSSLQCSVVIRSPVCCNFKDYMLCSVLSLNTQRLWMKFAVFLKFGSHHFCWKSFKNNVDSLQINVQKARVLSFLQAWN